MAAVDLDMIQAMAKILQKDPKTGRCDIRGLIQYIEKRQKDEGMLTALRHFCQIERKANGARNKDCSKVVFNAPPVQPGSVWMIRLHFSGMRDAVGFPVSMRRAKSEQGLRRSYRVYSWIREGPDEDIDRARLMHEYVDSPPTSKQLEDFIRMSMALPSATMEPCLPNDLIISSDFREHIPAISPFLDSLPPPFKWGVEPKYVEASYHAREFSARKEIFRRYVNIAQEIKERANAQFAAKNMEKAVEFYTHALGFVDKSLVRLNSDEPKDEEMIEEAGGLQSILSANMSCAYFLMPGRKGYRMANIHAQSAIAFDELYPKGYLRLSRVFQAQGELALAEDAIIQGLRLPGLQDNKDLVDHLISLQTGGKGLPTDSNAFKKWFEETFSDGQDRATRMKGVGGLWLKLCNEHAEKMRSPGAD